MPVVVSSRGKSGQGVRSTRVAGLPLDGGSEQLQWLGVWSIPNPCPAASVPGLILRIGSMQQPCFLLQSFCRHAALCILTVSKLFLALSGICGQRGTVALAIFSGFSGLSGLISVF